MSKYIKHIQIHAIVDCWETLNVESWAKAEATDVIDKGILKRHIDSVITKTLIELGLHPREPSTSIIADVDDMIDE